MNYDLVACGPWKLDGFISRRVVLRHDGAKREYVVHTEILHEDGPNHYDNGFYTHDIKRAWMDFDFRVRRMLGIETYTHANPV
jgi:hypothetical protein